VTARPSTGSRSGFTTRARASWQKGLKGIAQRAGVEISHWRPPTRRLADYLEAHDIRTVLDVGASSGLFGATLREAGFRGRIISFEPLAAPFQALSEAAAADPPWEAHRLALGDARGRLHMNVASNSFSSSFLDMEETHVVAAAWSQYVDQEEVDVERLDDVAPALGLVGPTLLKLDVQGYHLTVLHGARETLEGIAAIQCELSVLPLYAGEPGFLDALNEIRTLGFEMTELEPGFYDPRTGRILQFDGRFSRPGAKGTRIASANRSSV